MLWHSRADAVSDGRMGGAGSATGSWNCWELCGSCGGCGLFEQGMAGGVWAGKCRASAGLLMDLSCFSAVPAEPGLF